MLTFYFAQLLSAEGQIIGATKFTATTKHAAFLAIERIKAGEAASFKITKSIWTPSQLANAINSRKA
jgi:hypothetical protein